MSYSEKERLLPHEPVTSTLESDVGCSAIMLLVTTPIANLATQLKNLIIGEDLSQFAFTDEDDSDDEELEELEYNTKLSASKIPSGEKLRKLRELMKEHNIGVYIVPSEDEHQSEYTALSDKRREFLTEFTGSAGIAVVTLDDPETLGGTAALSTDGRYFLQAEKELDSKHWTLLKAGVAGYKSWTQFAIDNAIENKFSNVISTDPRLISISKGEYFEDNKVGYKYKYEFKPILVNLVDLVWGDEKPTRSLDPVFPYAIEFSGESSNDKVERVREKLETLKSNHLIVTDLDDVAWLFNLRSTSDIPFNTSFFAYAIVTLTSVTLYVNKSKIDKLSKSHLDEIKSLSIKDYDEFYLDLNLLTGSIYNSSLSIVFPFKANATYALLDSIPESLAKRQIKYESIISILKTYKNKTELKNAQIAQNKDSLAIIIAIAWLEYNLVYKKRKITEYDFAKKIYDVRTKFPNFKGLSFEVIASSGANSSYPHYSPTKENHSVIDPQQVFLADTGAQFLEGTTDITRSFYFGKKGLSLHLQKHYSLVLKGHLGVAVAKFAPNSPSTGTILDAISRQPLWNEGLDFNHGTGHGVGSFGNVHEGPLSISTSSGGPLSSTLFNKGGIISDEPGYYVDGEYGFRIESELEIIELDDKFGKTRAGENYLGFNYLTQVPFSRNLVNKKYFTSLEIKWINDYHKNIRTLFGRTLVELGDKRAYKWLLRETNPY